MNEEISMNTESKVSDKAMIEFIDVHKWIGEFHDLQGIDLTVGKQERIVI